MVLLLLYAVTLINCLSLKVGAYFQRLLNVLKIVLVSAIVGLSAYFVHRDEGKLLKSNFTDSFQGSTPAGGSTAIIAALWAFDGWSDVVSCFYCSRFAAAPAARVLLLLLLLLLLHPSCRSC